MNETHYQLLLLVCTLIASEFPTWLRERFKWCYCPIYFSFFPFSELNRDLSIYLNDDVFYGGEFPTDDEARILKNRILLKGLSSMGIAVIFMPLYSGVLCATLLSRPYFYLFVGIVAFYKVARISLSIRGFREHAVATPKNLFSLCILYLFYMGVFFELLRRSYNWAVPFAQTSDWRGLFLAAHSIIFGDFIAGAVLISLLTTYLINRLTDPEMRNKNVSLAE